jgi:hypothetical protein
LKNLGGSEKIASELFHEMDVDEDGIVTEEEISQTLDDILLKFEKEYPNDPSSKLTFLGKSLTVTDSH